MNKQCPKCNQSNPSEAAFCLNCAAPLAPAAFGNQQQNQQWNQPPNYGGQPSPGFGGQPSFAQPPMNQNVSGRATTALVLGIAGFFCCGVFTGIPAMIVGWMEISAIRQGQSPPNGMKFAQIGLWGGAIATVLHIIGWAVWLFFSMSMAVVSDPYYY